MGIEPIAGCLQDSLAPLEHASPFRQRSARDSNPVFLPTKEACFRNTCRPKVIPDGLEPSSRGCKPGILTIKVRDQRVAEMGVEPTNDHQALDLAALPDLRTRP